MNYQEFMEKVLESTRPFAGKEGKVEINHLFKNNGIELDALVIMEKDSEMSPTIYLEPLYREYCNCGDFDYIIDRIRDIYLENKDRLDIDPECLKSFEGVRDVIVYKVINYESNKKLLRLVPHKRLLDLAIVFYCLLEHNEEFNATALVYNSNIKNWNVTVDDLFKVALTNTPRLLSYKISSMSKLIGQICDADSEEITVADNMYVLTNEFKTNGAACMLYKDVLFEFANSIGSDLYILPSSVHEVIILPKKEYMNKDELVKMVREVNVEGVSRDEMLSDNVYEYNMSVGKITL